MPPKTRITLANNVANARWCETHNRIECTKNKRAGGQCHGRAMRGLAACKTHAGHRRDVARAKGEAVINAWSAVGKPAGGQPLDAGMAVLGMLQMSWLRAAAYGELLRQQVAINERTEPDRDGMGPGDAVQSDGLIGYRYGAAGKDGNIYATNEEVRALVALESSERDRVVKYAKTAHDMGISERLTNLAEKWGDVVAGRITLILAGLALTPEQEAQVPQLIQAHLSNIDMTVNGGGE